MYRVPCGLANLGAAAPSAHLATYEVFAIDDLRSILLGLPAGDEVIVHAGGSATRLAAE